MRATRIVICAAAALLLHAGSLSAQAEKIPVPGALWQRIGPDEFPRTARDTGQLRAGAAVPPLTLVTEDGEPFDLDAALRRRPTVLVFFRHTWETLNLAVPNSVAHAWPKLQEMGWQAIAVYGGSHHDLCQGKPLQEMRLPFPVLADPNQEAGRAFGLVLEDEAEMRYGDRESPDRWLVKLGDREGYAAYGKAVYFIGTDAVVRYHYQYHTLGFTFGDVVRPGGVWTYEWFFEIPGQRALPTLNMTPGQIVSIADYFKDGRHRYPRRLADTARPAEVTALNLSYQGLTRIPDAVLECANLRTLLLNGNDIEELPARIGALAELRRLELSGNRVTAIPAEIGRLVKLRTLNLYGNRLRNLPPDIGRLTELEELVLCRNPLKELPAAIGNLKSVRKLRFFGHALTELPPEIGGMDGLIVLAVCGRRRTDGSFGGLRELPEEIGSLRNLTVLSLWGNSLTSVPERIGQLRNLNFLNLGENRLRKLPASIGDLTIRRALLLEHNRLESLPEEFSGCEVRAWLDVSDNLLTELPGTIGQMQPWRAMFARNRLASVPASIWQMEKCGQLDLSGNAIEELPPGAAEAERIQSLNLADNRLESLPEELYVLAARRGLRVYWAGNPLSEAEAQRAARTWPLRRPRE